MKYAGCCSTDSGCSSSQSYTNIGKGTELTRETTKKRATFRLPLCLDSIVSAYITLAYLAFSTISYSVLSIDNFTMPESFGFTGCTCFWVNPNAACLLE